MGDRPAVIHSLRRCRSLESLSVDLANIEHVFESERLPTAEQIARLEQMIECHCPSNTPESNALLERICASSRAENRAAADRLLAIGELFALRLRNCGGADECVLDTVETVSAEVAAALCISQGLASSYLGYARAMRERLPEVAKVFIAGELDYRLFQTIVYRTDLITDADVLAAVDAQLAVAAPRWPSMTPGRLAGRIDKIVYRADRDAVRPRKERQSDRGVWIGDFDSGVSEIHGSLFTPDGRALDKRLDTLAATVCEHDPRTKDQRRADALGALAAGADRLGCRCGLPDCCAGGKAAGPVVIHVIAEQAATDGTSDAAGSLVDVDGLIPPEMLSELAKSAKLVPLVHPGEVPPECGYRQSQQLADFVRCRDLTCRFPGCDRPAAGCDLDHTIAYADGGPTHASNLGCLCRLHHLLKTFGGWRNQQLRDGTMIWTSPSGDTYVTSPGSALLFPSLCRPTAEIAVSDPVSDDQCGERTAMMPTRRRSRAQNRARRIEAERRQNREAREAHHKQWVSTYFGPAPPGGEDDEPPPF
jgi:Domain of unknown function (DUF222)